MLRRTFLGATSLTALSGCAQLENANVFRNAADTSSNDAPFSFANVAEDAGFAYSVTAERRQAKGMITTAGVFAVDFDNDGWEDILALGSDRPVLFKNTGGTFERSDALPALEQSFETALFFDHNNDGWEDLLLLGKDRTPLFFENDEGAFREASIGFDRQLVEPIGAAAADFDGDGCPDVFIIQNGDWDATLPSGVHTLDVPLGEDNGNPNVLYRGDCERFTDVTEDAGITGERWSLATSFVDLTDDGLPDIHVANDFNRDELYRNNGDGTFERIDLPDTTNRNGMSSEVADFTGDGRLDIFVTNIWYDESIQNASGGTLDVRTDGNNLLVNQGDGTFEDRAELLGMEKGGWGWAAVAVDFDNDTRRDVAHATQRLEFYDQRRVLSEDAIRKLHEEQSYYRNPALWRQTEDGFDQLDPRSMGFETVDGRGLAHLDFNNDGKADLVMGNAGGSFKLYENVGTTGRALQIDVLGGETTPALGARVTVSLGSQTLVNVRDAKSDFLSQSTRVLHFGVGDHEVADVTVSWPDGTNTTVRDVATDQRIAISPDGVQRTIDLT